MKQRLHITIGIPVYNEEANIGILLDALCKQSRNNFVLDRILVINDGSTDKTTNVVENFTKKNMLVTYIDNDARWGVRYRTQQLLTKNKSTVLVFFDGDSKPQNRNTIDNLVGVFTNPQIKLATADLRPVKPTTNFEYMLFTWRNLWSAVTYSWKSGNNIYNFRGVGIAIRKDFAKTVKLPTNIVGATSHFLFLTAKQKALKTVFAPRAVINYRLAKSLQDYLLQLNRGQNDGSVLKSKFPKIYDIEYKIPKRLLLYIILKRIINKPVQTIMGLIFNTAIFLFNRNAHPSDHGGIWAIAKSTKTLTS